MNLDLHLHMCSPLKAFCYTEAIKLVYCLSHPIYIAPLLSGHFSKSRGWPLKDVRAKIFQHWYFSETFTRVRWWFSCVKNAKKWAVTDFVLERTCPEHHPKSEKNRASLAYKASVCFKPKTISQLNLWNDMFSAKYCLSEPIKWT